MKVWEPMFAHDTVSPNPSIQRVLTPMSEKPK